MTMTKIEKKLKKRSAEEVIAASPDTSEAPAKKKKKKDKTSEAVAPEENLKDEKKKKKKEKKAALAVGSPASSITDEVVVSKKASLQETLTPPSAAANNTLSKSPSSDDPWFAENNVFVSGVSAPKPAVSFSASGLPDVICAYLEKKFNGSTPSLIQACAWPLLLDGHDVFGVAKTGSGKSLAFALPYLAKRWQEMKAAGKKTKKAKHYPRALVLAPTKELVQQIAEVVEEFCGVLNMELTTHCIIGGLPKYLKLIV